ILPKVNHGALFGLGGERETLPHAIFAGLGAWIGLDAARMANMVFAAISLLAVLAIIYWSTRGSTASDGCLCAALGLVWAGTLGNLYDRVVFTAYGTSYTSTGSSFLSLTSPTLAWYVVPSSC